MGRMPTTVEHQIENTKCGPRRGPHQTADASCDTASGVGTMRSDTEAGIITNGKVQRGASASTSRVEHPWSFGLDQLEHCRGDLDVLRVLVGMPGPQQLLERLLSGLM